MNFLIALALSLFFLACSPPSRSERRSQFSNCPQTLVKSESYCGVKHWWNKGSVAISNLLEIKLDADCRASYSFYSLRKDGASKQVTCGDADWGLSEKNEVIIDPNGLAWVGNQNLGRISLNEKGFHSEDDANLIFYSPCPFKTDNYMCK